MEELDPIIRDLGASASRPQELVSCTSHTHTLKYKTMGLFLILVLVLMLAAQETLLWTNILPLLLTITVSASFITEKRTEK
jgi:hypothetical protein